MRLAQQGHNRKKAVVIISDGNDTSSRTDVFAVKQLIRETEVLVYAIGIDSAGSNDVDHVARSRSAAAARPAAAADPAAVPDAGRPPPAAGAAAARAARRRPVPRRRRRQLALAGGGSDDRVNVAALRDITDDSGGRTEIVR